MQQLRPRITYANVMATIALFVGLGGSSYAAVTLSKNSVKSKHIASGQVRRSDIGPNAVDSSKIANGALRTSDFASGQLPAGPAGQRGAQGPPGPKGDEGDAGTTVVAEPQSTGPVLTASTSDPNEGGTPIPLSGASWTQGAGEHNLVISEVDYTPPADCVAAVDGGSGTVEVLVDAKRFMGGAGFGEEPFFFLERQVQ